MISANELDKSKKLGVEAKSLAEGVGHHHRVSWHSSKKCTSFNKQVYIEAVVIE